MFFWVTALLTLILSPFALIFGKITKVTIVKKMTPKSLHSKFPMASLTPVVLMEPREWLRKKMKGQVHAYALLGFVIFDTDGGDTMVHEMVHLLQQSTFSPILHTLVYLLDVFMFLPFRSYYRKNKWRSIATAEGVARVVGAQETK